MLQFAGKSMIERIELAFDKLWQTMKRKARKAA